MKFLIDECCDAVVARTLRDLGHDVANIAGELRGASDAEVLSLTAKDGRIVVTEDKDFGELIRRGDTDAAGLVLMRLPQRDSAAKAARIRELLAGHGHRLFGSYVVVASDKIRIRPLV